MSIAAEVEARDHQRKESQTKGFQAFIASPETKLLMSMVPESSPKESLETLLQSAFNHGYSAGEGEILVSMITSMFKSKDKDGGF